MSVDLVVRLQRSKMPTPARWAAAIRSAGFSVDLDEGFDVDADAGFRKDARAVAEGQKALKNMGELRTANRFYRVHHRGEVNSWIKRIEDVMPELGKKTEAEWRTRLQVGGGGGQ